MNCSHLYSDAVVLGTAFDIELKTLRGGAVVVVQLVERLLPIPEVCGSNPVIGKKLYLY